TLRDAPLSNRNSLRWLVISRPSADTAPRVESPSSSSSLTNAENLLEVEIGFFPSGTRAFNVMCFLGFLLGVGLSSSVSEDESPDLFFLLAAESAAFVSCHLWKAALCASRIAAIEPGTAAGGVGSASDLGL